MLISIHDKIWIIKKEKKTDIGANRSTFALNLIRSKVTELHIVTKPKSVSFINLIEYIFCMCVLVFGIRYSSSSSIEIGFMLKSNANK